MKSPEYFIGLMSGTSLDGIDAALVQFSSQHCQLTQTFYTPYASALRERLLTFNAPTENELHEAALIANELARHYGAAVKTLLAKADITAAQVSAIGCHGQTIRHRPEAGYTLQIGNAALLAELSGITVVSDFRSRDIAAGGHGAPLVPAFHAAMFRDTTLHRVIVNIGGIANLTDLPPDGRVTGFDTGPGNALLDGWTWRHRGQHFDKAGEWARTGKVIPSLLDMLLEHPFFRQAPPKSAGREEFNLDWLDRQLSGSERPEHVQATLVQLTATTIARAIDAYCPGAQEVYLCGGGVHNRELVAGLQAALAGRKLGNTNELGVDADWVEAFAFAWLARQTLHGKPGNLPEVTGAAHPCILGAIYPA